MSTDLSFVSMGIVVVACAALIVLDRIGRPKVATGGRKHHREVATGGAPGAWEVKVEPEQASGWLRVRSIAGLAGIVVAIGVLTAAVLGGVIAIAYLILEGASS